MPSQEPTGLPSTFQSQAASSSNKKNHAKKANYFDYCGFISGHDDRMYFVGMDLLEKANTKSEL